MADILTTEIDPVDGLVSYVNFTKPYHTKVLEVLVEYIHTDCIDVTMEERFWFHIGMPGSDVLELWGWTEAQALAQYNYNFKTYQLVQQNLDPQGSPIPATTLPEDVGYWEVAGNVSSDFSIGDVILIKTDALQHFQYTISNITTATTDQSVTRLHVAETIPIGSVSNGVVIPASSMSYNPKTGVYTSRAGIVFPSPTHVDANIDCGGYGSIYQQAVGSPAGLPDGLDTSNAIIGVSTTPMYFDISNTAGVPSVINTWEEAFIYGAKFTVTGSTGNDSDDFTVYMAVPIVGSPELLRIYVLENIPSSVADGTLQLRPWGYEEPRDCVEQGQSLSTNATIAENMSITINDNYINFVQGWDTFGWDMVGYDGGPFTYQVAFT